MRQNSVIVYKKPLSDHGAVEDSDDDVFFKLSMAQNLNYVSQNTEIRCYSLHSEFHLKCRFCEHHVCGSQTVKQLLRVLCNQTALHLHRASRELLSEVCPQMLASTEISLRRLA